jgi:thiol-disulfide isomerase/thioredoxin
MYLWIQFNKQMKYLKSTTTTIMLITALLFSGINLLGQDYPTLEIGQAAPEFKLPGVDGKDYSLKDFNDNNFLVIMFICNHCPTAQSYEDRMIQLVNDYKDKGVGFLAVSPNDPLSVRLDEMGYTDLGDDLEDMKIRAEYKKYNFPYIYDGETQDMSKKYGPVATPHVFIFDQERKLRYTGRIDDSEIAVRPDTKHDTRKALEALLAGNQVPVTKTKTFGCSIKWSDKRESAKKAFEKILQEEVKLEEISVEGVEALVQNKPEKLTLINVWATWCGPCVTEFLDLVEISLMYRHRAFEFINISADKLSNKDKVLDFLKTKHSSGRNYIFNGIDNYALIEAVDENWQGALPYTMLIRSDGEVIYARQDAIDPLEMKRKIVEVLGREKDW